MRLAEEVADSVIAKVQQLESRIMTLSQIIGFHLLDILGHEGARVIGGILEKEGMLDKLCCTNN